MWLAVDSGNTRVKWAIVRGGKIADCGAGENALALTVAAKQIGGAGDAWIANVGGEKRAMQIKRALPSGFRARFLLSPLRGGGLRCRYRPLRALGVDRWLALFAAKNEKAARVIVADAGSALTVDALDGGEFLGGVIVPGARLMRFALRAKTGLPTVTVANAKKAEALPLPSSLPGRGTVAAIAGGTVAALAGTVLEFRRRVLPGAKILVTGGDGGGLLPWLPQSAVCHRPHLVIEGIIARREKR